MVAWKSNYMHSADVSIWDIVYRIRIPTWWSLKTWTGYLSWTKYVTYKFDPVFENNWSIEWRGLSCTRGLSGTHSKGWKADGSLVFVPKSSSAEWLNGIALDRCYWSLSTPKYVILGPGKRFAAKLMLIELRNRRRDDLRDLSSELSLLRLQETLSTSNRTKRNVKTGGRRQKHPCKISMTLVEGNWWLRVPVLPDGLVEEFKHMSPEMQLYIRLKNAEMENISDSEGSTAVTSSATMATERRKRRRRRRKKPYSKQKGSEYTHDGTDEEGECMMEGIRW